MAFSFEPRSSHWAERASRADRVVLTFGQSGSAKLCELVEALGVGDGRERGEGTTCRRSHRSLSTDVRRSRHTRLLRDFVRTKLDRAKRLHARLAEI